MTDERKEEWHIEELGQNGEWNGERSFTKIPVINKGYTTLDDVRNAIKQLKAEFPESKYRIYHWIPTTTASWAGDEEWLDEKGNKLR